MHYMLVTTQYYIEFFSGDIEAYKEADVYDIPIEEFARLLEINDTYLGRRSISDRLNVHVSIVDKLITRSIPKVVPVRWFNLEKRYSPYQVSEIEYYYNNHYGVRNGSIPVGLYDNNNRLIGVYKSISELHSKVTGISKTALDHMVGKNTCGSKGVRVAMITQEQFNSNGDVYGVEHTFSVGAPKTPMRIKVTDSEGSHVYKSQKETSELIGVSQSAISLVVNDNYVNSKNKVNGYKIEKY